MPPELRSGRVDRRSKMRLEAYGNGGETDALGGYLLTGDSAAGTAIYRSTSADSYRRHSRDDELSTADLEQSRSAASMSRARDREQWPPMSITDERVLEEALFGREVPSEQHRLSSSLPARRQQSPSVSSSSSLSRTPNRFAASVGARLNDTNPWRLTPMKYDTNTMEGVPSQVLGELPLTPLTQRLLSTSVSSPLHSSLPASSPLSAAHPFASSLMSPEVPADWEEREQRRREREQHRQRSKSQPHSPMTQRMASSRASRPATSQPRTPRTPKTPQRRTARSNFESPMTPSSLSSPSSALPLSASRRAQLQRQQQHEERQRAKQLEEIQLRSPASNTFVAQLFK